MKCPACTKAVFQPNVKETQAGVPFGHTWKCLAFTCPSCSAVLSIQLDPVALKTDTLRAVEKLLEPIAQQLNQIRRALP